MFTTSVSIRRLPLAVFSTSASAAQVQVKDRTAFEVTLAPEAETHAMLMAGLGLVGFATRRRRAAV